MTLWRWRRKVWEDAKKMLDTHCILKLLMAPLDCKVVDATARKQYVVKQLASFLGCQTLWRCRKKVCEEAGVKISAKWSWTGLLPPSSIVTLKLHPKRYTLHPPTPDPNLQHTRHTHPNTLLSHPPVLSLHGLVTSCLSLALSKDLVEVQEEGLRRSRRENLSKLVLHWLVAPLQHRHSEPTPHTLHATPSNP